MIDTAYIYMPSIAPQNGEVATVCDELVTLGIDTIILSELRVKTGDCAVAAYVWGVGDPLDIGLWLYEAGLRGISVYIGLVASGGCTNGISHTEPNISQDAVEADFLVDYVLDNWGYVGLDTLAGWSLVNESALAYHTDATIQQQHYDYFSAQVDAIRAQETAHSRAPGTIVTAPYLYGVYTGTSWDGTFQSPAAVAAKAVAFRDNTGVDVQIWQPNLGGIAGFDWDRQSVYAADYFEALYDALGSGLWSDVELFTQPAGFTGSGYRPGLMSMVAHAIDFPAARRASFLQPYHMGSASAGHHAQSARLLAAYRAWYDLYGVYIRPHSYTWDIEPQTTQADTGNYKLFDLKTGDTAEPNLGPDAASDHNWVGFDGDAAVTIDMGATYTLRWVGAHVYHNGVDVEFPDSMTVKTSSNGTSWKTRGTYPWPTGVTKAGGDYVFTNDTALGVRCRYVRLAFVSAAQTRIGEVELIGLEIPRGRVQMNSYEVGDLVRLSATFTNDAGAVTDPTTVSLLLKLRYVIGATTTTYTYPATISKDSTGVFHVDVTPTTEGIWDYRWVGTGAVQAADEGAFNVPNSEFF